MERTKGSSWEPRVAPVPQPQCSIPHLPTGEGLCFVRIPQGITKARVE